MHRTFARIVACALLAGCTKIGTTAPGSTSSGPGRHPGTIPEYLRIGVQNQPNTLNPLLSANTTEGALSRLMFDGLVSVDESGEKEVPILAQAVPTLENGGISKDGLTITYHLRPSVKWHDGVPFTSKDVKFSWQAILNPNNNVETHTGYELVRSVDTPDPNTVVFHMKKRFSPMINTVFGESDSPYMIVPEHILGTLHDINNVPFNAAPIGTGPYKFVKWVRGDHIELTANDDYFMGKPKIRTIVIKIIPDENTELNQLRTHDLDWQFEASPDEYATLKTIPDLNIVLQNRNEFERMQINTKHPPLDDVRVRQAISYAIDRIKLTGDLTGGSAQAADQDLPRFLWAHSDDITRYTPDVARAKALLAQAGWNPGADGIATNGGKRLSLTLVTNVSNSTRRKGVVQLQAMLRAIGIEVDVKAYQGALLFATLGQGGVIQSGHYDLAWTGWVAGIDPDNSSSFTCAAQPPNGNNDTHYCNAAVDAAEAGALDNFDRPTRKKAYQIIESHLTRDIPVLPIWWPRQIQPVNPDLRNFTPNPVTATWNAYQWDI